ncbi:MAG: glycosyltransferase family 2 protein [Nitrospinae bacterium]|nr:glycosyltransferase family 2 protein [Nitrospinota bacterium]
MVSPQPVVSVVIPAFNRAHLLSRSVRSALDQDFRDTEVLVINDGSTDNTSEVVRELAKQDDRLKLVEHDRNKGEAAARNLGVREARGTFVAFLDSDDEWLPGKLSKQISVFRDAPSSVGAIMSRYSIISPDGSEEPVRDWTDILPITEINLLAKGCGLCMGVTFLVRKSVYDKIGYYDESLPIFVDLDWLCRLLSLYEIVKLDDVHARYHKSPMRRGEMLADGVRKYEAKNADHLNSFKWIDRIRIKSQFYNYISLAYAANGPWWKFIVSRFLHFAANPFQHPGNYKHFIFALLGIIRIGGKSS